jgi:ethanolamine ammonia-lyase small subunit
MTSREPGPRTTRDSWGSLTRLTPARIALGRAGVSLPTAQSLAFGLAHARARDAVHAPFDVEAVCVGLRGLGHEPVVVASKATSREIYLRRPDLGRQLDDQSRSLLVARATPCDLSLVVADGLSASAVHAQAVPLLAALAAPIAAQGLTLAPVVVARGGRVALGDEIGGLLQARLVAVLIGERPGLSTPDSLGVYLTYAPRPGRSDAERNCLSNIHGGGHLPQHAALKLAWLLGEALRGSLTGVDLKDASDELHAPQSSGELSG